MELSEQDYGAHAATEELSPIRILVGLKLLVGVAIVAICGGCASSRVDAYFMETKSQANVYVRPDRSAVSKIAVLPFKGPTELIGASVSDMFVTEMLRANKYTLVERSQMAGVLSETELALAGLSESKAVEVARMLGADGVVIGTVDEYATQARSGKTYAVAGVSTRLIHTTTGQIIWSADLAKMADKANTPLSQHGRMVVHEITAGLYQQWVHQKSSSVKKTSAAHTQVAPPAVALVPVPLEAPHALTASDMGLREVTLNWQVSRAPVGKVRIERARSIDGPFLPLDTIAASKGMYRDRKNLKDGAVYYYQAVTLGDDGRQSRPSPVVESMTAPPPDAPQEVSVRALSPRAVSVSWMPPRSGGATKYRIERAVGEAGTEWRVRNETDSMMWVDGGKAGSDVADSTVYRYRVTAINRVGAVGTPSASVEVKTWPPPSVVEAFFATTLQVRCVPLAWAASTNRAVTGYTIERRDEPAGAFRPLVTVKDRMQTTFLDGKSDPGNLGDGKRYVYRIRAFNAVGSQSGWTEAEATTRAAPPPPLGVSVQCGLPRSVSLEWAISDDDQVVGYVIERREGRGDWVRAGGTDGIRSTRFTDRAGASESAPTGRLKDAMTYAYRVAALNTANVMSEWSEEREAVTKPAPLPPAEVTTSDDQPKQATVAWRANSEPDIEMYVVESRAIDGSRWREVGRTAETTLSEMKLGDGERRVYRVKAIDACTHESVWSVGVAGTARPLPPPPSGLQAKVSEGIASIQWEPGEGIVEYRVYRKKFFSSDQLASSKDPVVVLTAEQIGKKASIYVTGLGEMGLESLPSERVDVRIP